MSFLNFARTAARNVGKGLHTARRVGKAINGLNRTVVKMSGGKLDPLKKLQEVGENALQNAGISKEIIGRVKDGYAAGEKMYRKPRQRSYAAPAPAPRQWSQRDAYLSHLHSQMFG